MPLSDIELQEVAHHEAGHAVASIRFGISFEYVALTPEDESQYGLVMSRARRMRVYVSRRRLADQIFTLMAGEAAVRPFFTGSEEHFATTRRVDVEGAMWLLEKRGIYDPKQQDAQDAFLKFAEDERAAFVEAQRQRAIKWANDPDLLRGGYWAIQAVADALPYRGKLTRAEVAAIMKNAVVVVFGRPEKSAGCGAP